MSLTLYRAGLKHAPGPATEPRLTEFCEEVSEGYTAELYALTACRLGVKLDSYNWKNKVKPGPVNCFECLHVA